MSIRTAFLGILWTFITITMQAQGTFQYDQQSTTGNVFEGFSNIQASQPIGQSFTPSLNAVGFIQLQLGGENSGNNENAVVYLDLLSGSITGTVIGQSSTVTVPIGTEAGFNFIFSSPVTVSPGTTYYIQPVVESGDAIVNLSGLYNYSGGTAFTNGVAFSTANLYFREGIIVPEPSTWTLLIAGAGAILVYRRKGI